jgi:hypothetical protein
MNEREAIKREVLLDEIISKDDSDSLKNHVSLLLSKYGIPDKKIRIAIHENIDDFIPCSIFCHELGIAETIIKFLRENRRLSNKKISEVLGKSANNIAVSYGKLKNRKQFSEINYDYKLPFHIFKNSDMTTFETAVTYLKESQGFTFHKISIILKRDERTIWATYHRKR